MRKTLTLGTLVALTVPVATVVACENGQEGKDKSSTSTKAGSGVYVQKHKDSEYPQMNQYLYDKFVTRAAIANQFYNSKPSNYFSQYENERTKMKHKFNDRFAIFQISSKLSVVMNWHELYDWCNSTAPQAFPYK